MAKNNSQGGLKERIRLDVKLPRQHKVIMLNDDFTPMDFVVSVLVNIFKKEPAEANALMLAVHHEGQAVAGIYSLDIAMSLSNRTMQVARAAGYPLRTRVEPED